MNQSGKPPVAVPARTPRAAQAAWERLAKRARRENRWLARARRAAAPPRAAPLHPARQPAPERPRALPPARRWRRERVLRLVRLVRVSCLIGQFGIEPGARQAPIAFHRRVREAERIRCFGNRQTA